MKKQLTTTETTDELANQISDENARKWEENHNKISDAILIHFSTHRNMPSKTAIANATGINRNTVCKHLKSFTQNDVYQNQFDGYSLMAGQVLGQVFRAAVSGDLQAAKLFLDTVKPSSRNEKGTGAQNNYLQINKTVINQQVIQQLKPEQLVRIEEVIAKELQEEIKE